MQLIYPSVTYKNSFLEALKEFHAEGNEQSYDIDRIDYDFDGFLQHIEARSRGVGMPDQAVPDSLFWLVEGDDFIGRVSIRHTLNDSLKEYGGHIGYYIRPTKRGMGYGTKALPLALVEAKKLGIPRVLVTCDDDNIPSQKIIQRAGGVLQDVIETPLNPDKKKVMRWWIDT